MTVWIVEALEDWEEEVVDAGDDELEVDEEDPPLPP